MSEIVTPTGEIVLVDDDFDHPGAVSMSGNGYFKKEYDNG